MATHSPLARLRQMVVQKGWETSSLMFSKSRAKRARLCQSLQFLASNKIGPHPSVAPSFPHLLCRDDVCLSHHVVCNSCQHWHVCMAQIIEFETQKASPCYSPPSERRSWRFLQGAWWHFPGWENFKFSSPTSVVNSRPEYFLSGLADGCVCRIWNY